MNNLLRVRSDGTTSHSTKPAGGQVAGYAALCCRSILAYLTGMSRHSLIELLAIRLSPQADKSLVIHRALHIGLLATVLHRALLSRVISGLLIGIFSFQGHAGAIEKLKTFIAATHSAQANFTQEVLDQNGKHIQSASGTMQFQRPGKFRWSYQKPYEQLIVGDGTKFWLYDVDLNQVTVKKLDAALGSSPAALLSGSNEIEHGFTLAESGNKDNLEWLQATPKGQGNKGQDSSFNKILMAFNAQSELVVMELNDLFGHKTVLRFSAMQHNPKISEQQFRFTPPKGADVLSD
jgi:outer membrane lipoprotein carrier protein